MNKKLMIFKLVFVMALFSAFAPPSMAKDEAVFKSKIETKIKMEHKFSEAVLDRCLMACSASEMSCITKEDHIRHNLCHSKRELCENRCVDLHGPEAKATKAE